MAWHCSGFNMKDNVLKFCMMCKAEMIRFVVLTSCCGQTAVNDLVSPGPLLGVNYLEKEKKNA
ncbi:MAG: hypothetical protein CSA29_05195 [Desulfobacterales bacterium]|nr:MAG: hypothetical protein CSA29_05195 [Desulfobacterales bacterium]